MANKMVTGHAAKKKAKHKVRHMTISGADNGFLAETHHEPEDGKEGAYMEPSRQVFTGHKDLASHVMDTFGGGMDAKKPAEDEESGEEE
jgi:hypothetical protein